MIIVISLLLFLSVAVIYSSSSSLALQQLIFIIVGLIFFIVIRAFDYRSLKSVVKPLYILIIAFLLITLFLGFETRGSVRWIPLGLFNFQPSEFAKPILVLSLALFWSANLPTWKNILKSVALVLPVGFLIFRQPDLGTTLTVAFIWTAMLFAANLSFFKLAILVVSSFIIVPLGWFSLQNYQKQRLLSFLSPNQDPQGVGFHVIQSTIAVGSGELLGRGLGRGTQSRLQFLPEFRTDFIFAFIAEELGFVGSVIVICLYLLIFIIGFRMLAQLGDRFGELIVIGVLAMLFSQILINIGMNIGLVPITGITLPLLSYGGSSVVSTLISLGFLSSVGKFGMRKKQVSTFTL